MSTTAAKCLAMICVVLAGLCCASLIFGFIAGVFSFIWLIFVPFVTGKPGIDGFAYLANISRVSLWLWPLTLATLGCGIYCCVRLRGKTGFDLAVTAIICSCIHLAGTLLTVIGLYALWFF